VAASAGQYTFNMAGFAPGTYYVAGYMYNKVAKSFTFSHLNTSVIVPAPTFTLISPTSGTFTAGQPITITWTAPGVSANDIVSLCLDKDTKNLNGNEKWIEIDGVAASAGRFSFNTTGFAPGTYYIGGYMYNTIGKTFTTSHLLQSIIITGGSSQSTTNASIAANDLKDSPVSDSANSVGNSNDMIVASKNLIFSSSVHSELNASGAKTTDNTEEYDEDELLPASSDKEEEIAMVDSVFQNHDSWLDGTANKPWMV
jgi:hypothetical protein